MSRLVAYRRVSRVNGREGDSFQSPDQQLDAIKGYAKLHGHTIGKVFTELDRSGSRMDRPEFNRALELVESGRVGGIIVAKLDRFGRTLDALQVLKRIDEAGAEFVAVAEQFDTGTPMGKAMMRIALVFAELTLDNTRESWAMARAGAVARGIHVASKAPTGYDRDEAGRLVPNDDAPHVAEAFAMKIAGASWREIDDHLTANGVLTPYGSARWQPKALAGVIANRVYLGEARSGEFVNPNAHQPLVEDEVWEAAQRTKQAAPANSLGGALLSGIARCAGCGYALKADSQHDRAGNKRRLYRCRGRAPDGGDCPAPSASLGSVLEPFVVERFFAGIGERRAEGSALTSELEDAENALARARLELDTYVTAIDAETVGAEPFRRGAERRREAVDRALDRLDEVRDRAGLADLPQAEDLEERWPDLDLAERRAHLRAAIDAVLLKRGRGLPITDRAQMVWKGEGEPIEKPDRRRREYLRAKEVAHA